MAPDPNSSSGGSKREEASMKVPSKEPKKKDEKKEEDLSEEDLALKEQLELYVERVQDPDPNLQKEIRTSTSSMTSVPKPLKFLRPHYGTLKAYFDTMVDQDLKESLKYRLIGSEGDIGSWGHEYVSHVTLMKKQLKLQYQCSMLENLDVHFCPKLRTNGFFTFFPINDMLDEHGEVTCSVP